MTAIAAEPRPGSLNSGLGYAPALVVLTSLFFMWGLITSLNDILIPHLRSVFSLTYMQAMLVQFCFFGAYFVMSLPSGSLVGAFGYKRGIIIGLAISGCGCLLMYPAAGAQSYALFLLALFVLASGITLLQVAANPYVAILGSAERASSRLTLTQAFNSLGTTIGPYVGSILILTAHTSSVTGAATASRAEEAASVQGPYVGLALVLFTLAMAIALVKLPVVQATGSMGQTALARNEHRDSIWNHRHLAFGAIGIFMYVGGEVAIGSFLVNLFSQPDVAGLPEHVAGKYVAWYWGGAMIGRFIGSLVMTRVRPEHVLAFNAVAVMILLVIAMSSAGATAMWAILAIGLFNSIMFPTIFTLAIVGLGKHTGMASGILCMAIVGGAIIPVIQGYVADNTSVLASFAVPFFCYLYIAFYGARGSRPDTAIS